MTAPQVLVNGIPLDQARAKGYIYDPSKGGFWSTPPRAIGDTSRDIMEVRLGAVRSINEVQLDLPQFPYVCTIEYWNATTSAWAALPTTSGRAVQIVNTVSNPARLTAQVITPGQKHPQHGASNHWVSFDLQTKLLQTNRLRVILTRNVAAVPPKDSHGTPLLYSLGVRNFKVGQKVWSIDNTPKPPPTTLTTTSETFASTVDMYGTPLNFALRQNLPRHLLQGGQWKCEPQPIQSAVVPFYIDIRQPDGSPQVVDKLFLDPLYSGATVNMYYSNSTPDGDFATHDFPVEFPLAQLHGDYGISGSSGIYFSGASVGYAEINNKAIQWDPRQAWNLYLRFQPGFDATAAPDAGIYTIFDFDALSLRYSAATGMFEVASQNTHHTLDYTGWTLGQTIDVAINYDPAGGLTFRINQAAAATYTGQQLINDPCSVFRFGAQITQDGSSTNMGNYRLNAFMLKRSNDPELSLWDEWTADPYGTVELPYDPRDVDLTSPTTSALLRFTPSFLTLRSIPTSQNPTGFRGGVGDTYADLSWTPIPRDYKLRKGYFDLPRISARFIKLEFTNLSPEPYDSLDPVTRTVQKFTSVTTQMATTANVTWAIPPGSIRTNMNLAGGTLKYADQSPSSGNRMVTRNSFTPPSLGVRSDYSPTELYYTDDPSLAARLRDQDTLLGGQTWQPVATPSLRFINTTTHQYETVNVLHNTKVAYFVGLKTVSVYRTDYLAGNDTEAYYEFFHDQAHLTNTDWSLNAEEAQPPLYGLTSTAATPTYQTFYASTPDAAGSFTLESAIFPSQRQVYAIQFASIQSPLMQLLSDNEFNQTDYLGNGLLWTWDSVGDADIEPSLDLLSDVGSTVLVTRSTPAPTLPPPNPGDAAVPSGPWADPVNRRWGNMVAIYGTYDGVLHATTGYLTTYGDLSGLSTSGQSVIPPASGGETHYLLGGITGNEFISPHTAKGRVYAAARCVTERALEDDLWIQIITDAGQVVAEEPIEVNAGGIYEWYVGYQVGSAIGQTLDGQLQIDPITGYPEAVPGATANFLPSDTALSVRVVQKVATGDSWYVDNISLFEDPILWEFSIDGGQTYTPVFDIRNNARGVFVLPQPGNQLRYRVTGYYPNLMLSAVEVRPWYGDLLSAIPAGQGLQLKGPNMQPLDEYAPVGDDPFFSLWDKPIPQEWFMTYRLSLFPPQPARATVSTEWILPERIVPTVSTTAPEGQTPGGGSNLPGGAPNLNEISLLPIIVYQPPSS